MKRFELILILALNLSGVLSAQPHWKRVPSPNLNFSEHKLTHLSVYSDSSFWATGTATEMFNGNAFPVHFVAHYENGNWTTYQQIARKRAIWQGIAARGAQDVFAATNDSLFHFDGNNWQNVTGTLPTPAQSPPTIRSTPFSINSLNTTNGNVIMGGLKIASPVLSIANWMVSYDGSGWQEISLPNKYNDWNEISGIAAQQSQILAVGAGKNNSQRFLENVLRYDGNQWNMDSLPLPSLPPKSVLIDVFVRSSAYTDSDTAFALGRVGYSDSNCFSFSLPVAYTYHGNRWHVQRLPGFLSGFTYDIAGHYTNNMWASTDEGLFWKNVNGWQQPATVFDTVGKFIFDIEKTPKGLIAVGVDKLGNTLVLKINSGSGSTVGLADDFRISKYRAAYPNPMEKGRQLQLVNPWHKAAIVRVIDLTGRELAKLPLRAGNERSVTMRWPAGVYLLQFSAGSETFVRKLVVQ